MTAPATPKPPKKPRTKAKTKGPRSVLTEEFWATLRAVYQGGNYTQRDLVEFAKSRGVQISQSLISKRAVAEGWIKGSQMEEIRRDVEAQMQGHLGDTLKGMLDQHATVSQALLGEVVAHIRKANDLRRLDPEYVIPPMNLTQLVAAAEKAQVMHARAIGFDYRTGKPFAHDHDRQDGDTDLKDIHIRIMSPEQDAEQRQQSEAGDTLEDED